MRLSIIVQWKMIITADPLWWHTAESKIRYILGVRNSLSFLGHNGQVLSIAVHLHSTCTRGSSSITKRITDILSVIKEDLFLSGTHMGELLLPRFY